jgi:putative phosphonate transport system ATP-binding protein
MAEAQRAATQNAAYGDQPLLVAEGLGKNYGRLTACRDVSFALYPGEVLAIVGESGSGKSTLLQLLSAQLAPTAGCVSYRMRDGVLRDLAQLGEAERRFLFRTDWGYVHQDPSLGLRMAVSAGANVGERLMAVGWNHYGRIRDTASSWLERVEIDTGRIDDAPRTYSGGMRQRLQIARNLVTEPRLVFMDEPTGGLDVSVQARLLDLMRSLVSELGLAAIVVTHDLAVARLLSHRVMVMKEGRVIETGLFHVNAGECVVLAGPSGAGKSSILKMMFGNYRCDGGRIGIRHQGNVIDLAKAEPREILSVRRGTIGYVSQFLRAVPRVPTLDVVAEPLVVTGASRAEAREQAGQLLRCLNIPERLWMLPPSTFSGGEQQRVNIARGFICELPILLLDEPTASLDAANRDVVVQLIDEKKRAGVAMVAIVHDDEIRHLIADRIVDVTSFAAAA